MVDRKRLSTGDWVAAALRGLATGGLAAVAVEPLATQLGATKGSFYWHFANRDALLDATLQRWERIETEDVITLVNSEPDPHRRLRLLILVALGGLPERPIDRVELALQPHADHPLVAPVLARVTRRRIGYLGGLFSELGAAPTDAQRRALLAYSAYLGHAQLAHATPDVVPPRSKLPEHVDAVTATLTAGLPTSGKAS